MLNRQSLRLSSWFRRYKVPVLVNLTSFALLIVVGIIAIGTGPLSVHPVDVLRILTGSLSDQDQGLIDLSAIILQIRAPRVVMAILIGGTLAVSGAALQGLFRNPLADPTLIGVSSGSALFAALVIIWTGSSLAIFPQLINDFLLPLAAFIGGLVTTWVVYQISTKRNRTSVTTMLLAGIAINAVAGAGIGFLFFTADDLAIREFTFWTLGSLSGSVWPMVWVSAPFLLLTMIALPLLAKPLNMMMLGHQQASYLGLNTDRIKKVVIFFAALGVGASVAVSGVIGFVGLVVPHLLRLIMGPDHRFLMTASVFAGGLLLLASDLFARMVVVPAELPIGIVTSSIGAPFFLWLLIRKRATGLI